MVGYANRLEHCSVYLIKWIFNLQIYPNMEVKSLVQNEYIYIKSKFANRYKLSNRFKKKKTNKIKSKF